VRVYHMFTRGSDRHYQAVFARSFDQDAGAVHFAQELLDKFPVIEVWWGDVLVAVVHRDGHERPC